MQFTTREKLEVFPLNSRTRLPSPLSFNILLIILAKAMTTEGDQEDTNKGRCQKTKKLHICADSMILYIKDPREITRKFLQVGNTFCKLAGYKINTQINKLPI